MARPEPGDVKAAIEEALRDSAIDLARIAVDIGPNDEVRVRGMVNSAADEGVVTATAARVARRARSSCDIVVSLNYEALEDIVYEAGVESFPASDPPCWMSRSGQP